jgi:ABC-2 type transport system ATP-binding protein
MNSLTGRRNLELRSRFYPGAPERVSELLDRLGLQEAADREVRAYSTGMRQRLGIAASLLPDPELWILDEPTSGLDPRGRSEVRELIQEQGASPHRTVLVSSHDLHEIEQVCNHVLVLARGKLLVSGPVDQLLRNDRLVLDLQVEDPEAARVLLQKLPGCESLAPGETPGTLTLVGRPELAPLVAPALVKGGIPLLAMVPRSRSLEDFFLETVEEAPCS